MKSNYKISIITVTYNCEEVLEDTILSVIKQNYSNIEYILIDGNSSDGTLDIIRKYSGYISSWLSEPDGGIYDAMNKGLQKATGDWVIFMNAGDWFASADVLTKFFDNKSYDSNIAVIYGDTWIIKGDLIRYDKSREVLFASNDKKTNGFGSCHQSIFTMLKAAREYPFDLSFKIAADLRMLYNIHKAGYSCRHMCVPVAFYSQDGFSAKQPKKMHKDIVRALNQNDTILSRIKRVAHKILDKPIFWYSRHIGSRVGIRIYGWMKLEELKQPIKWFLD